INFAIRGVQMKNRKQHVIHTARQLFINKGFQKTSIQDILDNSGIAKGTFYNYFASKNELLMAIFQTIYDKFEQDRNELMIGRNPESIDIFIKQIAMQMEVNRTYMLSSLYEEVFFSNDMELKQFLQNGQLKMINWLYHRFIDLFGQSKKDYLVDCAVMFMGILHQSFKYYSM